MIFEINLTFPGSMIGLVFLALWLNACVSNWNEKNTRFHIIFCWMVLLRN